MLPQKAYIIRISSELSRRYAKNAADSCDRIGLPYEFVEGTENKTAYDAWSQCRFPVKTLGVYKSHKIDKAACATVSHARVWNMISSRKETAIVLEHDALMLHSVSIDIPDNIIVALGYKITDPVRYNHVAAGEAQRIDIIDGHEGAHAYALSWKTAESMLSELNTIGVSLPIDNTFFLKMRKTKIPLGIANPTPAIGWIRESTIWNASSTVNYPFIESFSRHYKP